MAIFRLVCFDGGPAYLAAAMLQEIKKILDDDPEHREFLDQANVFAGTSAGSWLALYLAQFKNPSEALNHVLDFWSGVLDAVRGKGLEGDLRLLAAGLTGRCSVLAPDRLRDFFIQVFGRTTRLRDLHHKVVVPAFQLDNGDPENRSWEDKVFANFLGDEADGDQLVVDVALRSGAAPVMLPAWQSITQQGPCYVDGGFFAPVPSLVAIAQVLNKFPESAKNLSLREEIAMLSCGVLRPRQYVDPRTTDGYANWGWYDWILDRRNPGLLLNIALSSGAGVTHYITRQLLGPDHYFRLAPALRANLPPNPLSGREMLALVEAAMSEDEIRQSLREAAKWLVSSDSAWFQLAVPSSGKARKKRMNLRAS